MFFFLLIPQLPRSTLFPTRRSSDLGAEARGGRADTHRDTHSADPAPVVGRVAGPHAARDAAQGPLPGAHVHRAVGRSEEHTSELQSHHDLVCRLLLEKKKILDIEAY